MVYRRLYKIAMENINQIAEEMLGQAYVAAIEKTYYWTTDEEVFANKQEAINHQIKYLLEEIDE